MDRRSLAGALLILTGACTTVPTPADYPQRLRALGTEPFWSIDIDGARIAWSTADQPQPRTAQLIRRETAGDLTLAGKLDGKAIAITIARGACSDGMSDREYRYSASVRIGETTLKGCGLLPDQ